MDYISSNRSQPQTFITAHKSEVHIITTHLPIHFPRCIFCVTRIFVSYKCKASRFVRFTILHQQNYKRQVGGNMWLRQMLQKHFSSCLKLYINHSKTTNTFRYSAKFAEISFKDLLTSFSVQATDEELPWSVCLCHASHYSHCRGETFLHYMRTVQCISS